MSYRHLLIFFSIFFFCVLLFPQKIFAATITMQNNPLQIGVDDEFTVDVQLSISAADNTIYYLRGVFYQQGTSNYCGYTWNGTDWFKGPFSNSGDQKQFYKVVITNHQWRGQLKVKIDASDNSCLASGTYGFKVERFTDNSNNGTFDTQTGQTVAVTIPTPKPTATPTPKILNTLTSKVIATALTTDTSSVDAVLGSVSADYLESLTPTPQNSPTKIIAGPLEKNLFFQLF